MVVPSEHEKLYRFFEFILLVKLILKKRKLELENNVSSFGLSRLNLIVIKKNKIKNSTKINLCY